MLMQEKLNIPVTEPGYPFISGFRITEFTLERLLDV